MVILNLSFFVFKSLYLLKVKVYSLGFKIKIVTWISVLDSLFNENYKIAILIYKNMNYLDSEILYQSSMFVHTLLTGILKKLNQYRHL